MTLSVRRDGGPVVGARGGWEEIGAPIDEIVASHSPRARTNIVLVSHDDEVSLNLTGGNDGVCSVV